MAIRALSSLLLIAAAVAAFPAGAHDDHSRHYPGERFEPGVDKEAIINTAWAGVPDHFDWDVGLSLNGSNDPMYTYVVTELGDPNDRVSPLVETRLAAHLTGAISLFNWVQIGAELPVLLFQARNAPADDGDAALTSLGVGDVRLYPKVRILRQRDGQHVDIAVQVPVSLPTGQFADYFGETGFTFTPTLLVSKTWGGLRVAGNAGLRVRTEQNTSFLDTTDNELIYRLGAGYQFDVIPERTSEVALNIAGVSRLGGFLGEIPVRNPVEIQGEVSHNVWGPVTVGLGAAFGIVSGSGGPDYRIFGSVGLAGRAPLDPDGDGVSGDKDKCPDQPETKNGFDDADGCPDNADADGDGIADLGNLATDKCPTSPEDKDGFEDDDGCPDDDDDKDGIAGDADKCPKDAEDKDGFEDTDGCPEADNDQDGVLDAADACPLVAEDKDAFEDVDGCVDPDNDKDTVLDADDKCPDEAGVVANKGCPDPDRDGDTVVDRLDNCPDEKGTVENAGCAVKQLVVIKAEKLEILDKVFFATAKDVIQNKSFALLDNVAAVLKSHPEIKMIRVEGHTDNAGDAVKNKDLSNRRAMSVVKYLVGKGVDAARLTGEGFGQERPIADNATADGKSQNRRVEFVIVQ
jgi:outer membrane protein OmpA-like peptidoglycan-associated protein